MDSADTIKESPGKERAEDPKVATSSKEVDASQKEVQGDSDVDSSTGIPTHPDSTSTILLAPNITPVSTESQSNEEVKEEVKEGKDEEGKEEHDSDDDFPQFEGGEARGRVVNPIAGGKPRPPPPRPRPK